MKYLPVVRRTTILRTDPCLLRTPPHPNATNRSVVTIDENVQSDSGAIDDDPLVGAIQGIADLPDVTTSAFLSRTHETPAALSLSFLPSILASLGGAALTILGAGGLPGLAPLPALTVLGGGGVVALIV